MNHTTGLCGSYSTQLYTTFYTAYTTDLQCSMYLDENYWSAGSFLPRASFLRDFCFYLLVKICKLCHEIVGHFYYIEYLLF